MATRGDKIVARWHSERARARGHARALGHDRPAGAAVPDRRRRRRGDRALPDDRRARAAARRRPDQDLLVRQRRRARAARRARARRATRCGCRTSSTSTSGTRSCRRSAWTARRPTSRSGRRARRSARSTPSPVVCRFPDVFTRALAMSGTYDLRRFFDARPTTSRDDFWVSSPLHFVPTLAGRHLDVLRTRYILHRLGRGPGRGHRRVVEPGERARARRASRTASTRGGPSGTTTG